jgi:hypothetical protein
LVVLEGEVVNGGFYQWLTNSSGETADFALEDLRLIGAHPQAVLAEEALSLGQRMDATLSAPATRQSSPGAACSLEARALWRAMFEEYEPEFGRLDDEFYRIQREHTFWGLFIQYVRRETASCTHSRNPVPPSALNE